MQFKAIVSFVVLGLASVAIASPATNGKILYLTIKQEDANSCVEQRGAEKADFEKIGDAY